MNHPFEACPADPEETAELYLLGLLNAEDAKKYEEHYFGCPRCSQVLQDTDRWIRAMRAALKPPEDPQKPE